MLTITVYPKDIRSVNNRPNESSLHSSAMSMNHYTLGSYGRGIFISKKSTTDSSGLHGTSSRSFKTQLLREISGTEQITGVLLTSVSLSQHFPNSVNQILNIKLNIPQRSLLIIVIYTALGKEVTTLLNKNWMQEDIRQIGMREIIREGFTKLINYKQKDF